MSTPRQRGLRMPAEWAPHERTLMAWPRRRELWRGALDDARTAHAAAADAIAAFEPVTMVADPADAAGARARCPAGVEILELPLDDSWLRDSGPIFVTGPGGERAGVHFGFNAWGGKFPPWDHDARVGALLVDHVGDEVIEAPFVLEGGSIAVDGQGTLLTTEQCLLDPSRNPLMSREEIEQGLGDFLGAECVVWLGQGLAADRDTDGHVDLIAAFTRPGEVLLQAGPPGTPDHEEMERNLERLEAAGLTVRRMAPLAYVDVEGERAVHSYMNFYVCNGAVIVPLAGAETDEEALATVAACHPEREIVGVPGAVLAFGGGGPHCITQQVPASSRE